MRHLSKKREKIVVEKTFYMGAFFLVFYFIIFIILLYPFRNIEWTTNQRIITVFGLVIITVLLTILLILSNRAYYWKEEEKSILEYINSQLESNKQIIIKPKKTDKFESLFIYLSHNYIFYAEQNQKKSELVDVMILFLESKDNVFIESIEKDIFLDYYQIQIN